ncbi:hypothetical protein BDB01DRAFT_832769 [Pilobolus umbonatus]|nr:hypothetical protein BDB01DRAFT_832769 [Pilobolus umbonatus]
MFFYNKKNVFICLSTGHPSVLSPSTPLLLAIVSPYCVDYEYTSPPLYKMTDFHSDRFNLVIEHAKYVFWSIISQHLFDGSTITLGVEIEKDSPLFNFSCNTLSAVNPVGLLVGVGRKGEVFIEDKPRHQNEFTFLEAISRSYVEVVRSRSTLREKI